MNNTIFVVDDNETNLATAKEAIKEHYKVMTMTSAAKMFALLEKKIPDLILLDIEMPEMNGFEALEKLKSDPGYSDIPIIFLTAMTDVSIEVRGFQQGVVDFVTKPFSPPRLINRLKSHLNIDELIKKRTNELHNKTIQLQSLQNALVHVLADMVENRDKTTGGHIERTSAYLRILVNKMIEKEIYADELKEMNLDLLISSARLHDIGKITISDTILNKPGKLTDEEYEIMKTHCVEGEKILEHIGERTEDVEFLQYAKLFVISHHERWDGKGYPNRLKGPEIPLQGRIMSVVDVYDALVSERPYKKPFTSDQAMDIIQENSGTQFEPVIVDAFRAAQPEIEKVPVN